MTRKLILSAEEWEHLAPPYVGKVRVNHNSTTCDGGRDSMLIERKEDDSLSCYCFRCGGSGYIRPPRGYKHPSRVHAYHPSVAPKPTVSPPADAHGEWTAFPREAREWLLKGGVSSVIAAEQGIQWSDSGNVLWIPARQYSRVTSGYKDSGWILRGFNPKSYLTRTNDKDNMYGYYPSSVITNTIVIVEDVISAIKCSQVVDAIAILGTHPKQAMIQKVLSEGYRKAFVFLDGDNPVVRMKAREIGRRLPFVETQVVEVGCDPKECSIDVLKEILK